MTKYVAYYRVSTREQGKSGLGLEAQEATVHRHLTKQDDLIAPPFIEVESGRKAARPELEKALSRCRLMKATLIVAKVDRLTRSASFLETLKAYNVDVVFCDLPGIDGAVGTFMLQQMASVAQLEAGLISERTKAALAARIADPKKGKWDRKSKHHLVPGAGQKEATNAVRQKAQQRAADVLPVIHEIRASGSPSLRQVAAELNHRGITTARGKEWQAVQVKRLLDRDAAESIRASP